MRGARGPRRAAPVPEPTWRASRGIPWYLRAPTTMRVPPPLQKLIDYGIIEDVVRPLMSGKEAQIYLVLAGGVQRVAKLYKEATQRSFQNRASYTEGRGTRNTRDRRAMNKRSRHGREQDEEAWRNAEVEAMYKLRQAGVRVPEPYNYSDGVLVMELVSDADGNPAPRLGDAQLTTDEAKGVFDQLLSSVVRMLCAGVVHGDLSEFNVLLAEDGPVIIDFPQAVDPASNRNARRLLLRDVENLKRFLARFASLGGRRSYGEEMWELYEENQLNAETQLGGRTRRPAPARTDIRNVLDLVRSDERDKLRSEPRRGSRRGGASKTGRGGPGGPGGPGVQVAVRSSGGRWLATDSVHATSNASQPTGAAARSNPSAPAVDSPRARRRKPRSARTAARSHASAAKPANSSNSSNSSKPTEREARGTDGPERPRGSRRRSRKPSAAPRS